MTAAFAKLASRILKIRSRPRALWPAAELTRGLHWRILLYRWPQRGLIVALATASAVGGLAVPYFQKTFLDVLLGYQPSAGGASDVTWRLAALIGAAFACMMFSQAATVLVRICCAREGTIAQGQLSEALYAHALRLSSESRSQRTIGEMTNLYTADASASTVILEEFLPSILSSLLPFIAAPIALSWYFDLPLFATSAMLTAACGILLAMSYRQSGYFHAFKRLAAERMAIVNEWAQNIRIIRILNWVREFEERIFAKREEETQNRIAMVTNGSVMNSLAQVAPLLINVVGISTLIQAHQGRITPGDIFALMWVFGVFLARPIRMMPWNLVILLDGLTSCRRLEQFFRMAEEGGGKPLPATPRPAAAPKLAAGAPAELAPGLSIRGLSLRYGSKAVLTEVSLDIKAGEFVAIIGGVGTGKSQFLLSLLREAPARFDAYRIDGQDALGLSLQDLRSRFALIPQDGFVMSASLRDNVAFEYGCGRSADEGILAALAVAQFGADLRSLPGGLDAEIGERGVNLSGGQRQRVSLARAYFADRPIILMDDSLSAVDIDTEKKLIDELLRGAWARKTRILVTHRLSVLPHVDRVFVMEGGILKERRGSKRLP